MEWSLEFSRKLGECAMRGCAEIPPCGAKLYGWIDIDIGDGLGRLDGVFVWVEVWQNILIRSGGR